MLLFERPDSGETALIIHVNFFKQSENTLDEFIELVKSASVSPIAVIEASRQRPDPKYYVGTGKVEEIKQALLAHSADVVLFNHTLSPAQERNLEQVLQCRVLDRTGVILDIFAQRARSFEGKLQVELAQLNHMSTRLVRGWTHLERQKGGIGLRGPGETQLETDRRLLSDRIKQLNKRLLKVKNQREQSRKSRKRAYIPTVSLVGYTNAGKSSLFNSLADADVYAENKLFATLDPSLRRVELPNKQSIILADTVGFIRQLPHDLVNAFHATLQEVKEADFLLHVVDAHCEENHQHIGQVNEVIKLVDADEVPELLVYNKIDLFKEDENRTDFHPRLDRDEQGKVKAVWISALTGAGMELLQQAIAEFFSGTHCTKTISIPASEGNIRALLYETTTVLSEQNNELGDSIIEFNCSLDQHAKIANKLGS